MNILPQAQHTLFYWPSQSTSSRRLTSNRMFCLKASQISNMSVLCQQLTGTSIEEEHRGEHDQELCIFMFSHPHGMK